MVNEECRGCKKLGPNGECSEALSGKVWVIYDTYQKCFRETCSEEGKLLDVRLLNRLLWPERYLD